MDFGMPTLIEIPSLSDTVTLCSHLGLQFFEINMNLPQYQFPALNSAILRQYQNSPVYFTLHLDENLNIWDFNPLVSKAYFDTVRASITIALECGMPVINMHMHSGVYFTLPGEKVFLFDRFVDTYLEKTEAFKNICEKAIGKSSLKICIENCDGFTGFQTKALELLLQSPAFGLTLDIGHNHLAGGKDEAFILRHREKLCHMHMHDATSCANHLPLGTGNINIQQKLRLAQHRNLRCVLETKTEEGLRLSVENIKSRHFLP